MAHLYLSPTATIKRVKEQAEKSNQDIFPVVDDSGLYKGFIRASDWNNFEDTTTVDEVLDECDNLERRDVYVYVDTDVAQARKVLSTNRMSFVPIVDYTGHYVGTLDYSST
jgi:predicted transcriptional regulator